MKTEAKICEHDYFADESKALCECLSAMARIRSSSRIKVLNLLSLAITGTDVDDSVDIETQDESADNHDSWKPKIPFEGFPLFPHRSGQWAKKIKGKFWYFGVWADPQAALNKFNLQIEDIRMGNDPRKVCDSCLAAFERTKTAHVDAIDQSQSTVE